MQKYKIDTGLTVYEFTLSFGPEKLSKDEYNKRLIYKILHHNDMTLEEFEVYMRHES